MGPQHTSTETTTSPSDFFGALGDIMIRNLLNTMKPKDIYVECEVHDVEEEEQ